MTGMYTNDTYMMFTIVMTTDFTKQKPIQRFAFD